jgi:hypothetical protein
MSMHRGGGERRVTFGKVWSDAFAILQRDWISLMVMAVALAGLPSFLLGLVVVAAKTNPAYGAAIGIVGLVDLPILFILQGAMVHASAQVLEGAAPSTGESLRIGARAWLSLLGLALLVYLAFLGFALVPMLVMAGVYMALAKAPWVAIVGALVVLGAFVPGFMLLVRWSVAVPALLTEGLGVRASMGRSARLTKGSRWTAAGVFLVLWIALLVMNGRTWNGPQSMMVVSTFRQLAISPLLSVVGALLTYPLTASLFHHLRLVRDGGAPEILAQVFD